MKIMIHCFEDAKRNENNDIVKLLKDSGSVGEDISLLISTDFTAALQRALPLICGTNTQVSMMTLL